MRRILLVIGLLLTACSERNGEHVEPETAGLPAHADSVSGPGYRGVLFTESPVDIREGVLPPSWPRPLDLTLWVSLPESASFRRASTDDVRAFEARLPAFWEQYMSECPDGRCPFEPGTSYLLPRWERHYMGYADSTGSPMLWVQFYPAGDERWEGPAYDGGPPTLLPLVVDDGGPRYFTLRYSVERDSVVYVWFNGLG